MTYIQHLWCGVIQYWYNEQGELEKVVIEGIGKHREFTRKIVWSEE